MKKSVKIELTNDGNNIIISDCVNKDEETLIEINIGSWMNTVGGDDGESIFFTTDEFSEFMTECSSLLNFVIKRDSNG